MWDVMDRVFNAGSKLGILFSAIIFICGIIGMGSGVSLITLRRVNEGFERIKWSVVGMLLAPLIIPVAKLLWDLGKDLMQTVF